MRDYQGTLTGEFASRFPEVNIDSILTANQNRNPAIDHRNFTDVGENLIGQFGDLRIPAGDIPGLLGSDAAREYTQISNSGRTQGSIESGPQSFGFRSLVKPRFRSSVPGYEANLYKHIEKKKGKGKPEEFSLGGIAASAGMGALSGSALGFPWGTILGGAAGLVSGISGHVSEKRQERARDQQLSSQQSMIEQQTQLGAEQAAELAFTQRDEYTRGMGQGSNAFAPTFPLGGIIPYEKEEYKQDANAELEKGEVYRTPDKMIYKIGNNAKTHVQGGELMQLPEGTEILGKDTVANGETAKELGNRLADMQTKHLKILENRPTSIERETSKRMLSKVDEQYSNIMVKQQSKKGVRPNNLSQPKKFARGDVVDPMQETLNYDISQGGMNSEGGGNPWGGGTGLAYGIGMGLSTLGGLYNIWQGTQPATQLDPQLYRNQASTRNPYAAQALSTMGKRRVNINPYLTANRQAEATGRYNIRRQGVGQGQYLGNLAALSGQRMRGDERAQQFKTNREADFARDTAQMQYGIGRDQTMLGFQRGQFNAQQDFRTAQVNLQSEAAQRAYMGQGLSDIGGAGQMFARNMMSANRDKMKMDLLPDMFDMYDYNKRTGFSFRQPQEGG